MNHKHDAESSGSGFEDDLPAAAATLNREIHSNTRKEHSKKRELRAISMI